MLFLGGWENGKIDKDWGMVFVNGGSLICVDLG